jgi:AraC family transcriptional regulator, transcriptional activator of pobA
MKPFARDLPVLHTVSEYTRFYGLPAPTHPLLTLIDLSQSRNWERATTPVMQEMYLVSLKKNMRGGQIQYGYQTYDFSEGVMSFIAPRQACWASPDMDVSAMEGWMLVIHPDLLLKHPLRERILSYGFFSYNTNEALHVSAREETVLNSLVANLRDEINQPVDAFSQDVLVSQLDVLLTYADRFYHRQFLTRRTAEHDLLSRFEQSLATYFAQSSDATEHPLPTVQHFADELNVSPAYLSDMLRTLTGQNTQQHIHQALIDKAKQLLLTTSLSINETAYQLGFEYPQYFTRLFKNKTGLTPAAFRLSMQ